VLRYRLAFLEQLHDFLHHLPARVTCITTAGTRHRSVLSTPVTFRRRQAADGGCGNTTVAMHYMHSSSSCAQQR
jgi:hypothetical protein